MQNESIIDIPTPITTLIKNVFSGEQAQWPEWESTIEADFLEIIIAHRLVPIIHYQDYKTGCCRDWPDSLRSKIADIARQETAIELGREKELRSVLELLKENKIYPLLMKGTPLSYVLYPTPGLRPRCDTDLLIRKEDKSKVTDLMKASGYQSFFEVSADFLSSQRTLHKRDNMNIYHAYDFHWQISNITCPFSRELTYEKLIDSAHVIDELGDNAKTLGKVDAILLACFHRAAHYPYSGECLIWLYDIHLLIENISENKLLELYKKAQKLEITSICADAIFTAQEWFNTAIPERITLQFESPNNSEISASYLKLSRPSGIKNRAIMAFRELPSWSERIQYINEKLFPPIGYMLWRYNIKSRYLLPFFYFYRFFYGIYIFIRG